VFLLGMMIGSSSDEESSSSSEEAQRCRDRDWALWRWRTFGVASSSSTIIVVSTRARPLASIINVACVLVRGPVVSGIEDKLGNR
jgi:hypothetical protein